MRIRSACLLVFFSAAAACTPSARRSVAADGGAPSPASRSTAETKGAPTEGEPARKKVDIRFEVFREPEGNVLYALSDALALRLPLETFSEPDRCFLVRNACHGDACGTYHRGVSVRCAPAGAPTIVTIVSAREGVELRISVQDAAETVLPLGKSNTSRYPDFEDLVDLGEAIVQPEVRCPRGGDAGVTLTRTRLPMRFVLEDGATFTRGLPGGDVRLAEGRCRGGRMDGGSFHIDCDDARFDLQVDDGVLTGRVLRPSHGFPGRFGHASFGGRALPCGARLSLEPFDLGYAHEPWGEP